jgi:hypothetical protein
MNRLLLPVIAFTLVGCGSAPVRGAPASGPLSHAVARQTCAPWDGPAVSLVLAGDSLSAESVSPPYVEFRIYRSADQIAGQAFRFSVSSSDSGLALSCGGSERCDPVEAELEFDAVAPPRGLTGQYRLLLGGAWTTGSFRARWLARTEMCG